MKTTTAATIGIINANTGPKMANPVTAVVRLVIELEYVGSKFAKIATPIITPSITPSGAKPLESIPPTSIII